MQLKGSEKRVALNVKVSGLVLRDVGSKIYYQQERREPPILLPDGVVGRDSANFCVDNSASVWKLQQNREDWGAN
jgi:hypothetical protein